MKLFVFLLLTLPTACLAQTFTYNQGGTEAKNYYAEIPYETINGKIFLTGELAGKKRRFLFDTGAPCTISPELAAELNAKTIHKDLFHDAFMHTDSVTVVEVNDLKLGGVRFDHTPAVTLFPDFYKCYHIDGVIGSNLLRNSVVSIVDSKHVIIFTDQKSKLNLKSKNSVPLISNVGLQSDPQIKMVMKDKVTITIPFDTGDSDFLRINDKMITSLKQYALFDTLATGFGASGISAMGLQNAANKYLFKVAFLTVGNSRFNNLIVESNQDAIPAIGSKLLNYGTVTLDYINGKFYFDAYKTLNDLGEKHWPLDPGFADNKLIVGVVWQKAARLLTQGEQIIAVDGKDCSQITLCELLTTEPRLKGKETAILTIKDAQGNERKVTIMKE